MEPTNPLNAEGLPQYLFEVVNYYEPLWDQLTKLEPGELVIVVGNILAQMNEQQPATITALTDAMTFFGRMYTMLKKQALASGDISLENLGPEQVFYIFPRMQENVTSRPIPPTALSESNSVTSNVSEIPKGHIN